MKDTVLVLDYPLEELELEERKPILNRCAPGDAAVRRRGNQK